MTTKTVSQTRLWATAGLVSALGFGCGWADLANDQAIGRPCNLAANAAPNQAAYNGDATECPSKICLKPVVQPGAGGISNTGATCSGECTRDSDCGGELRDPTEAADTRCMRGFVCATPFVKGGLGCKKLCVCKDFLGPIGGPTPIACQGPDGAPPAVPAAGVEEQTDVYMTLGPLRQIDIVTMVDNSASMGPKVEKLNAQFPKLIEALRDPDDGTLPDLRVAIIDSDLGTGGAYPSGPCGPRTLADGTTSLFGDMGRFQMRSSPMSCTSIPGALFLEQQAGLARSYTGDLNTVFACLTSNLGTLGCGLAQQLEAFEFALVARDVGNDAQQAAFLRPSAQLGLIFLSDEDDCSVGLNFGMFGDKVELLGESTSLRCATRGHMCGGQNLSNTGPMYPTVASFDHPFSDCQARTDTCPNITDGYGAGTDTAQPTACAPLKNIGNLANEIKALKADPESQILVAGIFGWPIDAAAMAQARYKVAPVPTEDPLHPMVFDYWPVCYDPNHLPSTATTDPVTGFDATAAAWGATGGLREAAFVDQFGANGLKLSICQPDFASSLDSIGRALTRRVPNLCFEYKLVDTDLATPGIQADCRVALRIPVASGLDVTYQESVDPIPQCPPDATSATIARDCWQLTLDATQCPLSGQRIKLVRTAAEIAAEPQLAPGTKLGMQCRTCPALISASAVAAGCEY